MSPQSLVNCDALALAISPFHHTAEQKGALFYRGNIMDRHGPASCCHDSTKPEETEISGRTEARLKGLQQYMFSIIIIVIIIIIIYCTYSFIYNTFKLFSALNEISKLCPHL